MNKYWKIIMSTSLALIGSSQAYAEVSTWYCKGTDNFQNEIELVGSVAYIGEEYFQVLYTLKEEGMDEAYLLDDKGQNEGDKFYRISQETRYGKYEFAIWTGGNFSAVEPDTFYTANGIFKSNGGLLPDKKYSIMCKLDAL